ncbi:MAG: glycosyltransferase family 4 protein [Bacteroidales bacterium]|nr:glycosyltransferase family 4 protein [Bacteroidales bacterium]
MKKVLIITYYWPPSGGAGVQRWLKFVKYLRDFGWEPVVYTPKNPEYPAIDHSFEKDIPKNIEVIKRPITEPYSLYKRFSGLKKEERISAGFASEKEKPKVTENLSVWLRGNFFIPDARMLWIKPSVRFLRKYLKNHPVDAIVSTGPPHSMHRIARKLKHKLNIPWLADFRDPWTNIDFYNDLRLTKWADRKHQRQEKEVLQEADKVVVISPFMKKEFLQIHHREYEVVTNGFDEDDLAFDKTFQTDEKFSMAHIGTMTYSRNPISLWLSLQELVEEKPGFKEKLEIKLAGSIDHSVMNALKDHHLDRFVNKLPYLPHDKVVEIQRISQVLLLAINDTPNAKGILPGKFFEYLASGRPILCIGPGDGDAASIIKQTNTGRIAGYAEKVRIKKHIDDIFNDFQSNKLAAKGTAIEQFSRKKLTGKMASLLDGLT